MGKRSSRKQYPPKSVDLATRNLIKDARMLGIASAHIFIDDLFDKPYFNQPDSCSLIEMDGVIPGYLLRLAIDYYSRQNSTFKDNDVKLFLPNFCLAFDVVTTKILTPDNNNMWGEFTNCDRNTLLSHSVTKNELYNMYYKYSNGRYNNSKNLWDSKQYILNNVHSRTIISDSTKISFRLGERDAFKNFIASSSIDVNTVKQAEDLFNHHKDELTSLNMECSLVSWVKAYCYSYVNLWEYLVIRKMAISEVQKVYDEISN